MGDFATYRSRVRAARVSRSPEVIYNSSHDHAAVLIEELFHAGTGHVGVLCKNLNPEVYGREAVINAAQGFLERAGARMVILCKEQIAEDHPFVREVIEGERYCDHVTFFDKVDLPAEYVFNFMVTDGEAYRFESDEREPNAMACFSGRNVAQPMRDLLDDLSFSLRTERMHVSTTSPALA